MKVLALSVSFLLSFPVAGSSQQASSSGANSTHAVTMLTQSVAGLTGNTTLTDVALSGTARRIAGSDDDSGTVTLKAVSNGSARLDFSLSSGPSAEISNLSSTPAGAWSGPDSISHAISYHNLLTEPAWFSPSIAIARRISSSNFIAAYIGHETLNGHAVEHVSLSQVASSPDPPGGPSFSHLTQVDFYLDSTTLLPAALSFNVHPDNNALLDIPVEIQFSDYRNVSGAQIPFHIQKFLNNSLLLDLQIQSAALNTGLAASSFSIQ